MKVETSYSKNIYNTWAMSWLGVWFWYTFPTGVESCNGTNNTYIDKHKFCGGNEDCPDGSDEWVIIDKEIYRNMR